MGEILRDKESMCECKIHLSTAYAELRLLSPCGRWLKDGTSGLIKQYIV